VTIELLQDEKLRHADSHWPEEAGEKTFPGGRIKTLFVKDGVRVSETTLEPGAVVPSHHHNGPHLLVAVSDLDLRSDVEGGRRRWQNSSPAKSSGCRAAIPTR